MDLAIPQCQNDVELKKLPILACRESVTDSDTARSYNFNTAVSGLKTSYRPKTQLVIYLARYCNVLYLKNRCPAVRSF